DASNWSCAYDSVLTIIWNMYVDYGELWLQSVAPDNQLMSVLRSAFPTVQADSHLLAALRDTVRDVLFALQPGRFPRVGPVTAAAADVMTFLFQRHSRFGSCISVCSGCSCEFDASPDICQSYFWAIPEVAWSAYYNGRTSISASEYVTCALQGVFSHRCARCLIETPIKITLHEVPPILIIECNSAAVYADAEIAVTVLHAQTTMRLGGIIYHGQNHFTIRYINKDRIVWYHDGASTQAVCVPQGPLQQMSDRELTSTNSRSACYYVYISA
ncbi:uncharacterized protein TRAVEDRAFT_131722, partial [Trametes versicolor FP-101664 SS1]|uniref:uncharacterized protein n=1 Tax=Trametes versicolor (strain FP-101664) TaxID=717944 RepID=UPI0004622DDA